MKKILIIALFLLAGTVCAQESIPDRELINPLTSEEMAIPPGRYQAGIDINHQCRVDMDIPRMEPVLVNKIVPVYGDFENLLVDSEGGIWYSESEALGYSRDEIVRLNPDGSIDFKRVFSPGKTEIIDTDMDTPDSDESDSQVIIITPAVACAGAVIFYIGCSESGYRNIEPGWAYLECIDFDGNTRWRTEPAGLNRLYAYAWRIAGDRIAMVTSDFTFDVFSIADGAHLETVDVPGWSPVSNTGPIAMDDGSWIIHGEDYLPETFGEFPYIYRLNPDGTYAWKAEYPTETFAFNLTMSDDNIILFGNHNGLRAVDANDGAELWRWWGGMYFASGVTPQGFFVVTCAGRQGGILGILDKDGNRSWRVETKPTVRGFDDLIIFSNGIMFGDGNGIRSVDSNGEIIWDIDLADLGGTEDSNAGQWCLNPTPDGGLVASGIDPSQGDFSDAIFIFAPGEISD